LFDEGKIGFVVPENLTTYPQEHPASKTGGGLSRPRRRRRPAHVTSPVYRIAFLGAGVVGGFDGYIGVGLADVPS
jgi:hypothetical protein